jgi:septal ring factor EnvC (AmiA/AmiB activator)
LVTLPRPEINNTDLSFVLPASGVVSGQKSIMIKTRPQSIIVSPARGLVLFSAPYKRLGHVIIIDHGQGYISTLRGMGQVFIEAGQDVQQGTPLGIIEQEKTGTIANGAMLYYELRYNGNIINPLTLLSGSNL